MKSSRKLLVDQEHLQIFQYDPAVRTIILEDSRRETLPFPYILFGIRRSGYKWSDYGALTCGFSNKPIESDNDLVYFPPLGNIYANFGVCLSPHSVGTLISKIIDEFWFTSFGADGIVGHEILKHFGNGLHPSSGYLYWKSFEDATQIPWPLQITFDQFKDTTGYGYTTKPIWTADKPPSQAILDAFYYYYCVRLKWKKFKRKK